MDWTIEIADNYALIDTHTSLALTSVGVPHIAYDVDIVAGDSLKHASKNGSWSTEIVDDVGRPLYPSLAIDSIGFLHIAYYERDNKDLKYAYEDAGGWNLETVASTGAVGNFCAMALDDSNNPHVVYRDASNNLVRYATKNGSWSFETIEAWPGSIVTPHMAIAIDSGGFPHAVYPIRTAGVFNLHYAYKDGGGWTVTTPIVVASAPSLKLDSDDFPHVGYRDNSGGDLGYAYQDADGWNLETVDNAAASTGWDSSLALNSGNPYISYYDLTNEALRYAYNTGSGWVLATIDSDGDVGQYSSIALDTNGNVHVSYYDYDNDYLKYAYLAAPMVSYTYFLLA